MKTLIVVAIVGCVVMIVGPRYIMPMINTEPDVLVGYACGEPAGEYMRMEIPISMVLLKKDPPKTQVLPHAVIQLWDEWIEEHFDVQDQEGQRVEFERSPYSKLIAEHKTGTQDSYLIGKVRIGGTYTYTYTPIIKEGKRYSITFTVPEEGIPFLRNNAKFVKEG